MRRDQVDSGRGKEDASMKEWNIVSQEEEGRRNEPREGLQKEKEVKVRKSSKKRSRLRWRDRERERSLRERRNVKQRCGREASEMMIQKGG